MLTTGADAAARSRVGPRPPPDLSPRHSPAPSGRPCPPVGVPQQMHQEAVQSPFLNSFHLRTCEAECNNLDRRSCARQAADRREGSPGALQGARPWACVGRALGESERIRPGQPAWPLSSEGQLWCPESVGLSRVGLAGLFLAGLGISACVRLPCVTRLPGRGACLLSPSSGNAGAPTLRPRVPGGRCATA